MSIKDSEIRGFKDSRMQGFNSRQNTLPLNRWRMKTETRGIGFSPCFYISPFSRSAVEIFPYFRDLADRTD
jgi:hypothetical protein